MISKIAVFNSKKHAKVILTLDKTSIQLVGANQIGKTTLIDTLNFLYCIDKNYMSFDNDKYSFEQTLDHLFPSDKNSYVVFENYKKKAGGYYCILLKRKISELEYYKIDYPFDELEFFEANGKIKDFAVFIDYLISNNIALSKIDKSKLFETFYSFDQSKNSVVWLKNEVNRKHFAEIYQYLINSKSINADSLQKALILANNRKNCTLKVFTDNTKKDTLIQLRKIHKEIDTFKGIKKEFDLFVNYLIEFNAKKEAIGQLFFTYQDYVSKKTRNLQLQIKETEQQIDIYEQINENIEPKKDALTKQITKLEIDAETKKTSIETCNNTLREIALLNPLNLSTENLKQNFEEKIESLDKQISEAQYYINNIEKNEYSVSQITKKLSDCKKKVESLNANIQNKEKLLLFNITKDVEKQKLLNALLSQELLDKGVTLKKIEHFTNFLTIFDGEIDISSVKEKPIETLEELEQRLEQTEKEISELEKSLVYATDLEKNQTKLRALINNKKSEESKKNKIELKTGNENQVKILTDEITSIKKQLDENRQEAQRIIKEINTNKDLFKKYNKQKTEFKEELDKLTQNYKFFANENLPEIACETIDIADINSFTDDFHKKIKIYKETEKTKNDLFNKLKYKANRENASENEFIEVISKEIEAIADKEIQAKGHLKSISDQIIHRVLEYLEDYKHFKFHFISQFNGLVKKYPISKIKEMTIEIEDNDTFIKDLILISKVEKVNIGQVQELYFDTTNQEQQEGLIKLEEYLNSAKSKEYEFAELFSIRIKAVYEDDTSKIINLKKQNESTGTIRMINLILFLLIIKYLKVDSDENKVIFFVDELSIDQTNISELVQFCKDNGFITIFAANSIGSGFEKYYFMRTSSENKGKVVLDETHIGKAKKYND